MAIKTERERENFSIVDFIGAKGDGGGGNNWSYKTCQAPVKMSPQQTNSTPSMSLYKRKRGIKKQKSQQLERSFTTYRVVQK